MVQARILDSYGQKGSKVLCKSEAKQFLADAISESKCGMTLSETELEVLFDKLDIMKSGTLTLTDIIQYFK